MNGEYDFGSQPAARIMGDAIYTMRRMNRAVRRWRYGA